MIALLVMSVVMPMSVGDDGIFSVIAALAFAGVVAAHGLMGEG